MGSNLLRSCFDSSQELLGRHPDRCAAPVPVAGAVAQLRIQRQLGAFVELKKTALQQVRHARDILHQGQYLDFFAK